MDPLDHLSLIDAARITGLTTDAIRARVKKGQIPVVRFGSRVFVLRRDLDEFVRTRYVPVAK
jgi:excisionase family DNA binding protein